MKGGGSAGDLSQTHPQKPNKSDEERKAPVEKVMMQRTSAAFLSCSPEHRQMHTKVSGENATKLPMACRVKSSKLLHPRYCTVPHATFRVQLRSILQCSLENKVRYTVSAQADTAIHTHLLHQCHQPLTPGRHMCFLTWGPRYPSWPTSVSHQPHLSSSLCLRHMLAAAGPHGTLPSGHSSITPGLGAQNLAQCSGRCRLCEPWC